MKSVLVIVILILKVFTCESLEKQVTCERVADSRWDEPVGLQKTCSMQIDTSIDSNGFKVLTKDETMGGLSLSNNKKVSFLLIKLHDSFPNLVALLANGCSVKTISQENFFNLTKLKSLGLAGNQIETIPSNIFVGLTSLQELLLHENRIKKMNGKTFLHLKKLAVVWLEENSCINENFEDPTRIAVLVNVVTKKCGYDDLGDFSDMITTSTSVEIKEKILAYKKQNVRNIQKLAISRSKIIELQERIQVLEGRNCTV